MHSSTDDDPDCPPEFRPDPEAVARRAAELRAHRQRKVACPACGWVGKVTSYDKIRKHLDGGQMCRRSWTPAPEA